MSFMLVGKALVDVDRVLCVQKADIQNNENAITITFDTGQAVVIEDDNPVVTIKDLLKIQGNLPQ
jgi:hypothetical protein